MYRPNPLFVPGVSNFYAPAAVEKPAAPTGVDLYAR
jgi:hypothetical protein